MKIKNNSLRLNHYLAAGVGVAALPTAAEASIVYFNVDPGNRTIGVNETLNFGSINLSNGTYVLNGTGGSSFGLFFDGYGSSGPLFAELKPTGNIEWGANGPYVERLASNDNISGASAWSWGSPFLNLFTDYSAYYGNWGFTGPFDSKTGFAPLRINAGSGNYHYGWAEITTEAGNINSPPYLGTATVTITGFAFNTTVNQAIQAGAIPEPSTVTCLILGGSAFAFSRRRRLSKEKLAS